MCVDIPAHVGGNASLEVKGAKESQCKTHDGRRVAECTSNSGTPTGYGNYVGRVSGSCDRIVLGHLEKADFQHQIICESMTGEHVSVTYQLKGKNILLCHCLQQHILCTV